MSPEGGLTRNLCGDEVWILKAVEAVELRDLKWTVARHLQPSEKSMHISCSDTSTSFSASSSSMFLVVMMRNVFDDEWAACDAPDPSEQTLSIMHLYEYDRYVV